MRCLQKKTIAKLLYIYIDWRLSQPGFHPSFGNLACLATLKCSDRTKQICLWIYIYIYIYILTHTHTHAYIYIYVCVCVSVCVKIWTLTMHRLISRNTVTYIQFKFRHFIFTMFRHFCAKITMFAFAMVTQTCIIPVCIYPTPPPWEGCNTRFIF